MQQRLSVVALALMLAACSGGDRAASQQAAQKPAPSPAQTAAPDPGAPAQTASPDPATPATAAAQDPGTPAQASAPSPGTPAQAAPPDPARPAQDAAPDTPPAARQARSVTIPAGTRLSIRLSTALASDKNAVEDEVRGTLTRSLVVAGVTAVPAGSEVVGTVHDVKRSGRVKGRASIAFRFERVIVRGEALAVRTAAVSRQAASSRRSDVKKGAVGAAAGAIVGGIVGGGKGAAIGAGAGGAGAVLATRGIDVELGAGTVVRTTLQRPLTLVVPPGGGS